MLHGAPSGKLEFTGADLRAGLEPVGVLGQKQGIGRPSVLGLVIPKVLHSFAAICGGAESDIMVSRSRPRLLMGN